MCLVAIADDQPSIKQETEVMEEEEDFVVEPVEGQVSSTQKNIKHEPAEDDEDEQPAAFADSLSDAVRALIASDEGSYGR